MLLCSPSPDKTQTKLSNVRIKMPNSGQILPINFQDNLKMLLLQALYTHSGMCVHKINVTLCVLCCAVHPPTHPPTHPRHQVTPLHLALSRLRIISAGDAALSTPLSRKREIEQVSLCVCVSVCLCVCVCVCTCIECANINFIILKPLQVAQEMRLELPSSIIACNTYVCQLT